MIRYAWRAEIARVLENGKNARTRSNRSILGDQYIWEISPDLLGCGSTLELTDTHVTFVNSLSTASLGNGIQLLYRKILRT